MLATLVGATATGLYSIPSRLASFIIVLTSSFSSVLATRMAAFGDKEKEKKYLLKASLATLPIVAGIILWIVIAHPFITTLFGDKYEPAVPIFQALTAAMIPFLITAPSVTAITYSMKKTVYIGAYSFFQLAAIFVLNYLLIPRFGVFGPTITFAVTNTILAIYTWTIVIKYYWIDK
jgi:O-antigen/teichoic acid export membrane protein